MSRLNKIIGSYGEDIAVAHLLKEGYKILARNFRSRYGEIDIVASREKIICFVEVKSRYNSRFGSPRESITCLKSKRIMKIAEYYIYKNNLYNRFIRIDIIEVMLNHNNDNYNINFIKDAFRAF